MRALLAIAILSILIQDRETFAQITLDYSNDTVRMGESGFYCVNISENESKYVIERWNANSFSLYNMDMTPFITNIALPVTDSFYNGFVIAYISSTLFDCDSTNIEFVLQSPYGGRKPFRVLRTDGTVLLEVDSARGPYCFGCWGGTMDTRPIQKTAEGTKLFLDILNSSGKGIEVYSLCGELPPSGYTPATHETVYDTITYIIYDTVSVADTLDININLTGLPPDSLNTIKVYPNPTFDHIYIDNGNYALMSNYSLRITNGLGQVVFQSLINQQQFYLDLSTFGGHGTYFLTISDPLNQVVAIRKIILQ